MRTVTSLVLVFLLVGVSYADNNRDAKVDIVTKYMMAGIGGNPLEQYDEIISREYQDHQIQGRTIEDLKRTINSMVRAFPDLSHKFINFVVEKDLVVVHSIVSGTHRGSAFGKIEPKGKKFSIETIDIFRLKGTKIVEHWSVDNSWEMYRQLR